MPVPRGVGGRPGAAVPLYAVVATWHEADIIESCVANARLQGCERIFLIDNASTDGTVERAVAMGVELLECYETERYDERLRLRKMNDWAFEISEASGLEHLWWLFLDGDEFPSGPSGLRLVDYLARLGPRFRVVGSTTYNHYPDRVPAHVRGEHPADHQPLAERFVHPACAVGHYKHPLTRYDRGGDPPLVRLDVGFHYPETPHAPLLEPLPGIVTRHVPFRTEASTRSRLAEVNRRSPTNFPSVERERMADDLYAGRWDRVRLRRTRVGDRPIHPRPWWSTRRPAHSQIARWPALGLDPDDGSPGVDRIESVDQTGSPTTS